MTLETEGVVERVSPSPRKVSGPRGRRRTDDVDVRKTPRCTSFPVPTYPKINKVVWKGHRFFVSQEKSTEDLKTTTCLFRKMSKFNTSCLFLT